MRDLGYVEGANVAFAFRFADGQVAKLSTLANELVALRPAAEADDARNIRGRSMDFSTIPRAAAWSTSFGAQ